MDMAVETLHLHFPDFSKHLQTSLAIKYLGRYSPNLSSVRKQKANPDRKANLNLDSRNGKSGRNGSI